MKQKLTQKQIQKPVPLQLMLARLSQLSQTDLERAVLEELEKNPLLELNEDAQDGPATPESTVWESDETGGSVRISRGSFDVTDIMQADEPDFFDLLLKQVRESGLDDEEIVIAEEIIGSLDENGFLSGTPLENIAYKLSAPPEKTEKVLKEIQAIGPPGIAARDLRECMLIQLRANHAEAFVIDIVDRYFDDYMDGNIRRIRKALDLSDEDLLYAQEQIARLNPKPAAGHDEFMKNSIIPDVILRRKNGKFYLALNETGIPAVRLSDTYLKMMAQENIAKDARRYLSSHKQAAEWFIHAIEQRRQSMIAIALSIVQRQNDFLSGKRENPLPMVMKDVAGDTGLDISTVSRIVNGKYMQTPSDTYELRFFFSEKVDRHDKAPASTRDLEQDLLRIIEKEDKAQPLNDEALQSALRESGYNIARRTVAKYRDKMGIPGSRERRKT